jgi:hypothetical protein
MLRHTQINQTDCINAVAKIAVSVVLLSLSACTKKAFPVIGRAPSSTNNTPTYSEDLALYRPKFEPIEKKVLEPDRKQETPKYTTADQPLHVNRRLDMILDTIATRNRYIKHAQGFRIQIYVGNNRQEADAAKVYTYTNYPELNPYTIFASPTYRVKIGDFMTRLDAERYFSLMKDIFPGAMILPEKVEIKKGILIK